MINNKDLNFYKIKKSDTRKSKSEKFLSASILALFSLSGCSKGLETSSIDELGTDTETDTTDSAVVTVESSFNLKANSENFGITGTKDVIYGDNTSFVDETSLVDQSPYDSDELTVTATDDLVETPTISGIENIIFTTSENSLGGDLEFDINLLNISDYQILEVINTNENSPVKTVDVSNLSSTLSVGSHFSNLKVNTLENVDVVLTASSNLSISTTGGSKDLQIVAGGKSITLISTSTTGDVTIKNANSVDLNASSALGNLNITANGDVTVQDISKLKGNISVTSVGAIAIRNASNAEGTLTLSNERATGSDDIVITNATSVGKVIINSAGAFTATANNGLVSATNISVSATQDSTIYANGVENQEITLIAANPTGASTTFTLHASKVEKLTLSGTSPIVLDIAGSDISTETITNSNTDATVMLDSSNADLSNIDPSIKILVNNLDGNTLVVADNQTIQLDAEIDQTSSTSTPTFDHYRDASSSTSNSFTLKTFDSNSSNSDKTVNMAGFVVNDIQTLTIDLSAGVGLNSSSDITGADLTSVVLSGSGQFDLNSNTITGSSTSRVTLDASSLSEEINLCLDGTTNGVANIKTGSAIDTIKVDGTTSDASGFVIATNGSNDIVQITTSGDGESAKINFNGGDGNDTLSLDPGVDLSTSDLTLSSVEVLLLTGGGTTQKISASDISGTSLKLFEAGAGTAKLTVVADQNTINLANLSFDTSFASGTDSIEVDASTSSAGVTITGSSSDDTLTGSNANDVITGGDGGDIINAGTGNDTIAGGLGADTLTGGAGDDEFDFSTESSTETNMDKITDYQADADAEHNDTIDNITGSVGANTTAVDVKSAVANGSGSETVTASVTNGIVTLSGTNANLIDTLAEWIDVISVEGVIAAAADDDDAVGTVGFQFNGHTYVAESNDTFNNNTANINIINVIELSNLTGVSAIADAAAASTILIS
jgi:hypothetical protein